MGCINFRVGGAILLFGKHFEENCMKMKKNWTQRRVRILSILYLDPLVQFKIFIIFNENSNGMLNLVHLKLHFQCKTRSTFAYHMTVTLQV